MSHYERKNTPQNQNKNFILTNYNLNLNYYYKRIMYIFLLKILQGLKVEGKF